MPAPPSDIKPSIKGRAPSVPKEKMASILALARDRAELDHLWSLYHEEPTRNPQDAYATPLTRWPPTLRTSTPLTFPRSCLRVPHTSRAGDTHG